MPELKFDTQKFSDAVAHGQALKAAHSARNDMQNEMVNYYLMLWEDEDQVKASLAAAAVTRSPSVHNKVEGATRLLSTTAPKWSVPRETNPSTVDSKSEKMEKWISRVFECANRVTNSKAERDAALSQLLMGETIIAVDRTSDIVDLHLKRRDESGSDPWLEAAIKRAQAVAKRAPYLFTVWDPRTCYPSFDKLGLQAFYREVTTTVGDVHSEFGSVPGLSGASTDQVILCHYWDYVCRYTWLNGSGTPFVAEEHGLPFIPVVCTLGEGSRSLFNQPENWRMPFLYAVWKSNQWRNENLYLTVMATAIAAFGSNPMFTFEGELERDLNIDYNIPGGLVRLKPGERYQPTPKIVIDPSLMTGLERARADIEESTIYGQTLGQPIGANATYSMTALLHQAGRLPLAVPQDMAGRALAAAGKIALQWAKHSGKEQTAGYDGYEVELSPSDIPDNFELDCKLDVALPQDRLGNVNVARLATDPNNPLASTAWVQTNILGIEQPDQMMKEILSERTLQAMFMQYLQQMMQQAQMQQQGQAQPPQQEGMSPGQGIPPEVMAGGMQGPEPMPGEQQMLPPEGGADVPYGS